MVNYEIDTERFEFGDNRFENSLNKFGLKIKRIKTLGINSLTYEIEREKKLTDEEIDQIYCVDGVHEITNI